MFFSESKQLAKDHPALDPEIQAIDELLSSQSHTAVLCSEVVAGVLRLPESRVRNVLTQLATLALLNAKIVYECRRCGMYTPVVDVDASPLPECSACGKKLSAKSRTRSVFLFSGPAQQKLLGTKLRSRSEPKVDPMLFSDPAFKRANARRLLKSLFPNSQIDTFLSANFPDVYDEISLTMDRGAKLNLLFQMRTVEEIIEAIKQLS